MCLLCSRRGNRRPCLCVCVSTQINGPLDACMRNWDWVRQDSSVLLQDPRTLRCWDSIVPGSYFPGNGHVGFLAECRSHSFSGVVRCLRVRPGLTSSPVPAVFGNVTAKAGDSSWSLTMELAFRPVEDRGVLFAILDSHNNVSFSLSLNQTTKVAYLGVKSSYDQMPATSFFKT